MCQPRILLAFTCSWFMKRRYELLADFAKLVEKPERLSYMGRRRRTKLRLTVSPLAVLVGPQNGQSTLRQEGDGTHGSGYSRRTLFVK